MNDSDKTAHGYTIHTFLTYLSALQQARVDSVLRSAAKSEIIEGALETYRDKTLQSIMTAIGITTLNVNSDPLPWGLLIGASADAICFSASQRGSLTGVVFNFIEWMAEKTIFKSYGMNYQGSLSNPRNKPYLEAVITAALMMELNP